MSLPLPEHLSRNRSASTGTSSGLPEHEHKRPRLSEGQDYQQNGNNSTSVTAVPASSTPANVETATSSSKPGSYVSRPSTPSPDSPQQSPTHHLESLPATSPQSKVTINTRPISSQSSNLLLDSNTTNGTMKSMQHTQPSIAASKRPAESGSDDQHEVISLSSSSDLGSPPIQVAQPEDLDQDPADTHWEPISHRSLPSAIVIGPGHVQRTFPFIDQCRRSQTSTVLNDVAIVLAEGSRADGEVFREVKAWVLEFANNASHLDFAFFAEDRDFWLRFPALISGLLKRPLDLPNDVSFNDVVDFFEAYAQITTIVVNADIRKMRSCLEVVESLKSIPQPFSSAYFQQLKWILTAEVPLYKMLLERFGQAGSITVETIIDRLLKSHALKHLRCLISLFRAMADLFPKRVTLLEPGLALIEHARDFYLSITSRARSMESDSDQRDVYLNELASISTEFLESIDAILHRAISKQQPWLNIETCDVVLRQLSTLVHNLALHFPHLAAGLVVAASVSPNEFSPEDVAALAGTAWRFTSLQKLLKKGRMEVRVACIGFMARDLIDVYTNHIQRPHTDLDHPEVKFMVRFLRCNDILRYITSVDSHPQIINRSSNIIGFLCVSHSYLDDDTDMIWQTVLESQDPRAIVEVIGVVQANLDNLELHHLRHIADKLLTLPIERFEGHMVEFAFKVVGAGQNKISNLLNRADEIPASIECLMKLCLKLLLDTNTPDRVRTELSARIRLQMSNVIASMVKLMNNTLKIGEEPDLMRPLLVELSKNVETCNKLSCGSIVALTALIAEANDQESARVIVDHNLTPILVQNIVRACQSTLTAGLQESSWIEFEGRFGLLVFLIFRTPETVTESLLESLWTNVLASSDLNLRLRSLSWTSIGNIFTACRMRNSVLDEVVEKYLPTLCPSLFDAAILHFAQQSVKYAMQQSPAELMGRQSVVTIPGVERIWDIMLRAPRNTVELLASQFIIEQYLDSDQICRCDGASIEATHLALIDRCVQQTIDAAHHLKAPPGVSTDTNMLSSTSNSLSEDELHVRKFYRSLLFLRNFLENLKSRPQYAPAANDNFKQTLSTFGKKGSPFEVTLQIIGHKSLANSQFKWTLGYATEGSEAWKFLSEVTGWSELSIINGGRRIVLKDSHKTLEQLGIRPGSFMVSKAQGSSETMPLRSARATSPVDNKVMLHFDELYSLLDLEDKYAKEVFDFLRMFSSQQGTLQQLKSMTLSPGQLLPVERPFKLMYYARALRSCIEDESFSSDPNTSFVKYGVNTILSTLSNLDSLQADFGICVFIAHDLLETLVLAFRARVPTEVSKSYIVDGQRFVDDVLSLWSRALTLDGPNESIPSPVILVRAPFEALIEGTLHDESLWEIVNTSNLANCLLSSLLTHPLQDVRRTTLDVLHGLTGFTIPKSMAKNSASRSPRTRFSLTVINGCLEQIWEMLHPLVQHTKSYAANCEEFFDALISTFRHCRLKLGNDLVKSQVKNWKSLLLAHSYYNTVGLTAQDFLVSSLAKLLIEVVRSDPSSIPILNPETFVKQLFALFLFPPVNHIDQSNLDSDSPTNHSDPVLDMQSRTVLYELIAVLCQDKGCLGATCDELSDSIDLRDTCFLPTISNDKQCLRSEAGYSGLRNLSNTCYLNSLICQLFMNVEFRELIMNVNVIDESKQKLVSELGKVFADMQNSYKEAISPEAVIDAIRLWDGEQIDVSVQMDVDEFYNLLFDRLESQIVDPKVCSAFKSIYGGQLVQQIKSKECEHVSERLEPFAAVQVEIKGKTSLEESLRAYVEGEVLQGENKYSCTGCGKHVDAVKRACLKTVPDHLIFNLKRFDYDIMNGTRCKVNDEFGFPDSIDMAPYTLDALSNSERAVPSDLFELVGVIVHSGTAESGHYYSYIRQRPSAYTQDKSWVQFNDHDVTRFDPANIREHCFGGIDYSGVQIPRFFNGYMLFYQRTSSIQHFQRQYPEHSSIGPVYLPLATDLETRISRQNEIFLRTYVAQDPTHARFIKCLLQQKQNNESLRCPQQHDSITTRLLCTALEYVNHVSARWKDLPDVDETLNLLSTFASTCDQCVDDILDWLSSSGNLIDNLVRSCYPTVRKGFMILAVTCWARRSEAARRGQPSSRNCDGEYMTMVEKFLLVMFDGWDHVQRHGRAWEQYFGLLMVFVKLDPHEAQAVIESGFLRLALELVHVHVSLPATPRGLKQKYSIYLLCRERNRPFAHQYLIDMVACLIQQIDFEVPIGEAGNRIYSAGRYGLSAAEAALMGVTSDLQELMWLRKIILGRHNVDATDAIVAHISTIAELKRLLASLLKDGLNDGEVYHATAYLQPTLTFLSCCADTDLVIEVAEEALDCISTTKGFHGKDFQAFIQQLLQLSNTEAGIQQTAFLALVKKQILKWAPVLLLAPNDIHSDVRGDTLDTVNEVLFHNMDTHSQTDPRQYRKDVTYCRSLARACADLAKKTFLDVKQPNIQTGQAYQASQVVDHCMGFFNDTARDEELVGTITTIMENVRALADGAVEMVTDGDWNVSSDNEVISDGDVSEASN